MSGSKTEHFSNRPCSAVILYIVDELDENRILWEIVNDKETSSLLKGFKCPRQVNESSYLCRTIGQIGDNSHVTNLGHDDASGDTGVKTIAFLCPRPMML